MRSTQYLTFRDFLYLRDWQKVGRRGPAPAEMVAVSTPADRLGRSRAISTSYQIPSHGQ